jgi:hypothetical protein
MVKSSEIGGGVEQHQPMMMAEEEMVAVPELAPPDICIPVVPEVPMEPEDTAQV